MVTLLHCFACALRDTLLGYRPMSLMFNIESKAS